MSESDSNSSPIYQLLLIRGRHNEDDAFNRIPMLQDLRLKIEDNKKCEMSYKGYANFNHNSMFCAFNPNGDSCMVSLSPKYKIDMVRIAEFCSIINKGDSGGPLFIEVNSLIISSIYNFFLKKNLNIDEPQSVCSLRRCKFRLWLLA